MASPGDEDFVEDYGYEGEPPTKKQRKSTKGRSLMRWSVDTDQYLLLLVEHVSLRDGINIPWDAIGAMLQPQLTAEAIKQHLAKVRKHRMEEGLDVPPPLEKQKQPRRKTKPASNVASPAAYNAPAQQEGPKRSTLLPPPKKPRASRKRNTTTQGASKGSQKSAVMLDAQTPASSNSRPSFGQPAFAQGTSMATYQPHQAVLPSAPAPQSMMHCMTAEEQRMNDEIMRVSLQHNAVSLAAYPPIMKGLRNDVFLGVAQQQQQLVEYVSDSPGDEQLSLKLESSSGDELMELPYAQGGNAISEHTTFSGFQDDSETSHGTATSSEQDLYGDYQDGGNVFHAPIAPMIPPGSSQLWLDSSPPEQNMTIWASSTQDEAGMYMQAGSYGTSAGVDLWPDTVPRSYPALGSSTGMLSQASTSPSDTAYDSQSMLTHGFASTPVADYGMGLGFTDIPTGLGLNGGLDVELDALHGIGAFGAHPDDEEGEAGRIIYA